MKQQVSVTEGEVLEVLQFEEETGKNGWWMVKCPSGKEGLIPDSVVELLSTSTGSSSSSSSILVAA